VRRLGVRGRPASAPFPGRAFARLALPI